MWNPKESEAVPQTLGTCPSTSCGTPMCRPSHRRTRACTRVGGWTNRALRTMGKHAFPCTITTRYHLTLTKWITGKPLWGARVIDVNTSCPPERSPTALWPNGLIYSSSLLPQVTRVQGVARSGEYSSHLVIYWLQVENIPVSWPSIGYK
jgi:hypothetical protein